MPDLFEKCIAVVLKSEGGFTDDPDDIGNWTPDGELKGTKYGIASLYFPDVDIKNLTLRQAKDIYYDSFWTPMNLEGIWNQELVLQVFDFGVNAGKRRSIKLLQKLVEVEQDGSIGPITERAVNYFQPVCNMGAKYTLLDLFKSAREAYYRDLVNRIPARKKFLKGWLNRIEKTHL